MSDDAPSSTGLPSRLAAALSYAGWWITGVIFWVVERNDAYVRFHAAQAIAAFGGVAVLSGALLLLAGVSLSVVPSAFQLLASAAVVVWIAGMALWLVAMWTAASGRVWRIPLAARLADRLTAIRSSSAASS